MHRNSVINLPLALSSMGPDGGIVSTTDDLLRFLQGFWGGGLLRPETVIAMQTWNPLFFPLNYGYGVMRFKIPRWMALFRDTPEFVGHSGSTGSFAFYVPRHDVHIVGTFNQLDQARRPYNFLLKVLRIVQQHEATR
jgi:CubicO group peptidase (beta-lactamase class C family)